MSGEPKSAEDLLSDNLLKTRQLGLERLELETELALTVVEEKISQSETAHAHLADLRAKATSLGFIRIEHQAEVLR